GRGVLGAWIRKNPANGIRVTKMARVPSRQPAHSDQRALSGESILSLSPKSNPGGRSPSRRPQIGIDGSRPELEKTWKLLRVKRINSEHWAGRFGCLDS